MESIDVVAVTVGPGSFTSLRVGVTAAKTLAYVAGAKVAPVNTLQAIAWTFAEHAESVEGNLWGVINAERDEWFVQRFDAASLRAFQDRPKEYSLFSTDRLVTLPRPGDILMGSGVHRLAERVAHGVEVRELEPSAGAVARIAIGQAAAGFLVEPMELIPDYGRLSAAEEKHAAAGQR